MKILTYDPKKRKSLKVGDYLGGTFIRKVKPIHYMYTLKSYGMQDEVLKTLEEVGCKLVHLDTGKRILESHLRDWQYSAVIKNYGHGKQHFLSVDKMKVLEKCGERQ